MATKDTADGNGRRYASHNSYINFKRIVHDATHPGENPPPVPHPSTWFPPSPPGSPLRGLSHHRDTGPSRRDRANSAADGADDGSDSDIEAVSERISIKCPLTLLPMKDPVTSKKCPHSFERAAIMDMINGSAMRVGGSNRRGANDGEKATRCPVCEMVWIPCLPAPTPFFGGGVSSASISLDNPCLPITPGTESIR